MKVYNDIPILCIAFNRFEYSKILFDKLSELNFEKIYLSIDGPRNDFDRNNSKKIIDYAHKKFKSVILNHFLSNQGVRYAPPKGISWFFSKVEFGVILEDDCIPNESFFHFILAMYYTYTNEKKVLTIAGGSFSNEVKHIEESYYFSAYINIWGWATWKDRWMLYKNDIDEDKLNRLMTSFPWESYQEKMYFHKKMKPKNLTAWDFQLSFLSFSGRFLNVTPTITMIQNIGFNESTHRFLSDPLRERPAEKFILKNLTHPKKIEWNRKLDFRVFNETKKYSRKRIFRVVRANNLHRLISFAFYKLKSILK